MIRNIFLLTLVFALGQMNTKAQQSAQAVSYPTVLIELFSSEGCSSCPLADQFLKEMLTIADSVQAPVFCLDYHVDIWNKSGWVDRFSDTSFSRRQREYMVKNKQQALFTPMMYVNGGGGLPGNAKKDVSALINENMKMRPKASLMTKAGYIEETKMLVVDFDIEGTIDSCSIQFVLAYKEIESNITAGENAGQTLVHHHTAKYWKEVPLNGNKKGRVELALPPDVPISQLMLVSFIQHQPTWKVYATDQLMFR
jgi:hypothetical protein